MSGKITHITPLIREFYHNADSSNGKILQIQLSESVINFLDLFFLHSMSTDLLYGRSFWKFFNYIPLAFEANS